MSYQKRGGRPTLEFKREKSKIIYFTSEEFEKLNLLFSESDYLSSSDMIRDILLNKKYRVVTFDNDARIRRGILVEEVRRIGNNFNQLIKSFNQKKLDYFTPTEISLLIQNIDEIKQVYIKIDECIKSDLSKPVSPNIIS
ncbi:hypothetical protein ACHRV1_05365 [Flavobacterium aquidurense]|uniref:plasmid mobilization protein n=1 Tax=Flavobacterium aquidurense TaxID=362413 RepID=UPI003756979C